MVDMEGRMLLPGLQGSHSHPVLGATLERLCRLAKATTIYGGLDGVGWHSEISESRLLLTMLEGRVENCARHLLVAVEA